MPLKFSKRTNKPNKSISALRKLSAVRLMRIEMGGAFADLLNEKGKGSGDNEMGYVERTLGFRTKDLDDRDLRLIIRIGSYEIVKLDMPPYAVVDEDNNSLPLPKLEGDDRAQARALATLYSHPVNEQNAEVGKLSSLDIITLSLVDGKALDKVSWQEEAIRLMEWNNSEPSFNLRANSGKGVTRDDLVMQLNLLKIVMQAGLLKQGLCSVQDESAG
ncbi:hypothetical protein GH714_008541 [Hevea brasiliensis]|uniref:Uncharacterized protein n=1 Tax=Hevea brasiliensis TaxID=3981 RepID=A0A6A6N1J0_HEVBR|nr:hypothetical protein GH714_008541 [Hevea brasiliensis]